MREEKDSRTFVYKLFGKISGYKIRCNEQMREREVGEEMCGSDCKKKKNFENFNSVFYCLALYKVTIKKEENFTKSLTECVKEKKKV